MTRVLLVAAALALPLAASAQGVIPNNGQVRGDPDDVIGLGACAPESTEQIRLTWDVSIPATSPAFQGQGIYRLFATNKLVDGQDACPIQNDTSGTTGTVTAGQVGANIDAQTESQNALFLTRQIAAAAGVTTCDADKTIFICIHWYPNPDAGPDVANVGGVAKGQLTLQVAAPEAPPNLAAEPGESALIVSWGASSSTGATVDEYEVTATRSGPCPNTTTAPLPTPVPAECVDPAPPHVQTVTGSTRRTRVRDLYNGAPYSVTAVAIAVSGNRSEVAGPITGTPVNVSDFWEWYDGQDGKEQGGCASGAGGLAALVAAGALLAVRRRRS